MGPGRDRVVSRGVRGSLPVDMETTNAAAVINESQESPGESSSSSTSGTVAKRERRRHRRTHSTSETAEAAETAEEKSRDDQPSLPRVMVTGSVRERSHASRDSRHRSVRSHGSASGGKKRERPLLPQLSGREHENDAIFAGATVIPTSPKSDSSGTQGRHRLRHKSTSVLRVDSGETSRRRPENKRRRRLKERQQTLRQSLQDESKAAVWEQEFAELIAARERGQTICAVSPAELLSETTAHDHLIDTEIDPLEAISIREAELAARESALLARMALARERKQSNASNASTGSSGASKHSDSSQVSPNHSTADAHLETKSSSSTAEDGDHLAVPQSKSHGTSSSHRSSNVSKSVSEENVTLAVGKQAPSLPQDAKSAKKPKKDKKVKKVKKEKTKTIGTFFRHQRRDSQVVRGSARSVSDLSTDEIEEFKREQIAKYEAQLREAAASSTNRFLDVADRLNEQESSSSSSGSDMSDSEGMSGVKRRNSFSAFDLSTRRQLEEYKDARRHIADVPQTPAIVSHSGALVRVPTMRKAKSVREIIADKLRTSRPTLSYGTLPRTTRNREEQARILAQLIFDLPPVAIKRIFSFLLLPDIAQAARVCTSWHDATGDPAVWRDLLAHYDQSLYAEALAAGRIKETQLDQRIWDDPEVIKFDQRQLLQNVDSYAPVADENASEIASNKEKLSVNQLVARLTQSVGVADKTDWGAFFISYKSFTTPFQLCRKLIQRFAVPVPEQLVGLPSSDNELSDFIKTRVNPTQLRVCMAFKRLLDDHFSDLDASCLTLVRTFIRMVLLTSPTLAASLRKAFIAGLVRQRERSLPASLRPGNRRNSAHASKDILKELGVKKIELKSLLDVCKSNLQLVAEQLTLVEFGYLRRMKPVELVSQAYQKGDGDGGTQAMIDHFNDISRWVAKTILDEEKPRQRALRVQQFVEISDHLRKLRNYETLMAIISSLYDPSISRLKITRSLLRPRSARLMEELHTLMSADQSYAAYREAIAGLPTPMIPYLGVYMRDMIYYEDESYTKAPKGQEVAFWKKKLVFRIMESIETCQTKPYNLVVNPAMEAVLKDLPVPECGNEEYRNILFDLSLLREPRTMRRRRI